MALLLTKGSFCLALIQCFTSCVSVKPLIFPHQRRAGLLWTTASSPTASPETSGTPHFSSSSRSRRSERRSAVFYRSTLHTLTLKPNVYSTMQNCSGGGLGYKWRQSSDLHSKPSISSESFLVFSSNCILAYILAHWKKLTCHTCVYEQ